VIYEKWNVQIAAICFCGICGCEMNKKKI